MTCVICRSGTTAPGPHTMTLERGPTTVVIRGVPAEICNNCGEAYFDEASTATVLDHADRAAKAGVQIEVRDFVAA